MLGDGTEQTAGIFGRRMRQHIGMHTTQTGEDLEGLYHVGRLVALAAIGFGREIRGIGFDHQALGRNAQRSFADLSGTAEGQDAGKGYIKTESQKRASPMRQCR